MRTPSVPFNAKKHEASYQNAKGNTGRDSNYNPISLMNHFLVSCFDKQMEKSSCTTSQQVTAIEWFANTFQIRKLVYRNSNLSLQRYTFAFMEQGIFFWLIFSYSFLGISSEASLSCWRYYIFSWKTAPAKGLVPLLFGELQSTEVDLPSLTIWSRSGSTITGAWFDASHENSTCAALQKLWTSWIVYIKLEV